MAKSGDEILARLKDELNHRKSRAKSAYIKQGCAKIPLNCKHHGKEVHPGVFHCKIAAMGANQEEALICYSQKAMICPLHELKKSGSALAHEFNNMDEEEIQLRWPLIGTLDTLVKWGEADEDAANKSSDDRPPNGSNEGAG